MQLGAHRAGESAQLAPRAGEPSEPSEPGERQVRAHLPERFWTCGPGARAEESTFRKLRSLCCALLEQIAEPVELWASDPRLEKGLEVPVVRISYDRKLGVWNVDVLEFRLSSDSGVDLQRKTRRVGWKTIRAPFTTLG